MPQKMTPEFIEAAIAGFEAQKNHIDSQISELRSMLDGRNTGPAVTPPETGKRKRRRFSLASRRKMAAAQKARWAGIKKSEQPETAKPKKRKMSAAGRRAISIATKKRWAAIKAAKNVAKAAAE
jgi:hypothetical protein